MMTATFCHLSFSFIQLSAVQFNSMYFGLKHANFIKRHKSCVCCNL